MKTLAPVTAAAPETNWQVEYNKLRGQYLKLQRAFVDLQSAPRDAEASERNFRSVQRFVDSMPIAEGIVTCANIYNSLWFNNDADPAYARKLAAYFVNKFDSVSSLAEPTFNLWRRIAG